MRQEKPAQRDIPEEALRQSRRSRNLLAAYVLLLTAVVLAVFAVACAAVDRFGWKMDLTQNQVFRLTDTTKELLEELDLTELRSISPLFGEDVYEALSLEDCMSQRRSFGGPAVEETSRQIVELRQFIKENRHE